MSLTMYIPGTLSCAAFAVLMFVLNLSPQAAAVILLAYWLPTMSHALTLLEVKR